MGMSRQQAIKIISQMIKDEEGFLSDNTVEAHKMAIKALEQEPSTKNDLEVDKFDKAINQSDLKEWIMETFPDWCEGDVRLIMNHMNEMPSVTPQEPRIGHWKEVYAETDYRNGWIEFSCENCEYQHGLESGQYGWSYGDPIPWKFCPICGAKMAESEEI